MNSLIAHVKQLILHLAMLLLDKLFDYICKRTDIIGISQPGFKLEPDDPCNYDCEEEDSIL